MLLGKHPADCCGFDDAEKEAGECKRQKVDGLLPIHSGQRRYRAGSNRRTDAYGVSVEGRTRFTLEVVAAERSVRGADRVGIKNRFTVNDAFDDDPAEMYTYLARCLKPPGLANVPLKPFHAIALLSLVYYITGADR
jgi:NADH:flavin oxidoreductase / NADH oxidase family